MSLPNHTHRKLKALAEVEHHVTLALAKLNSYAGGTYIGDLRELKDITAVKLKLEQIQRCVSAGYRRKNERCRSRHIK